MNTMKNFDLCTGCNGYTAECTVCHKRSKVDSCSATGDDLFGPSINTSEYNFQKAKKKAIAKRRFYSEMAKNQAEKALVCATARYNRLPDSVSSSDFQILGKKCKNIEKRIHRSVIIAIDFPEFEENAKGSNFSELENLFTGWKKYSSAKISAACDTALAVLKLAKMHNGHVQEAWTDKKKETVLIKFGFFNQKDAEALKFDWENITNTAA